MGYDIGYGFFLHFICVVESLIIKLEHEEELELSLAMLEIHEPQWKKKLVMDLLYMYKGLG